MMQVITSKRHKIKILLTYMVYVPSIYVHFSNTCFIHLLIGKYTRKRKLNYWSSNSSYQLFALNYNPSFKSFILIYFKGDIFTFCTNSFLIFQIIFLLYLCLDITTYLVMLKYKNNS